MLMTPVCRACPVWAASGGLETACALSGGLPGLLGSARACPASGSLAELLGSASAPPAHSAWAASCSLDELLGSAPAHPVLQGALPAGRGAGVLGICALGAALLAGCALLILAAGALL